MWNISKTKRENNTFVKSTIKTLFSQQWIITTDSLPKVGFVHRLWTLTFEPEFGRLFTVREPLIFEPEFGRLFTVCEHLIFEPEFGRLFTVCEHLHLSICLLRRTRQYAHGRPLSWVMVVRLTDWRVRLARQRAKVWSLSLCLEKRYDARARRSRRAHFKQGS